MTRRSLLKAVIAAVFIAPLARATKWVAPRHVTEAIRARFYPGPLKPLDLSEILRNSKWAG